MSNRVTRRNNREHINIITHETYIEIDNGLFLDTTNYNFIEDLPGLDGATVDVNVVHNDFIIRSDIEEAIRAAIPTITNEREIVFYTGTQGMREFNEAIEESIRSPRPDRFHNMSEQEILNYLDQISQEE